MYEWMWCGGLFIPNSDCAKSLPLALHPTISSESQRVTHIKAILNYEWKLYCYRYLRRWLVVVSLWIVVVVCPEWLFTLYFSMFVANYQAICVMNIGQVKRVICADSRPFLFKWIEFGYTVVLSFKVGWTGRDGKRLVNKLNASNGNQNV